MMGLAAIYLVRDPFAVLRRPAAYYVASEAAPRNRDFVSTETLLAKSDARAYDSFVFGSSRSIPCQATDWKQHLDPARPYHYDASLESLFGIYTKVKYLDRSGFALRNVLMVVDEGLLRRPVDDDARAMFLKHPAVAGTSWLAFHVSMFEGFLSRGFF